MSYLTVSADHRHLEQNGKPFFWLADTIWSAFTNITLEDWAYYLKHRREQGFTVLQINTLAQWDRGESPLLWNPFALDADGFPIYSQPENGYFEHAREMCRMAKAEGFTLALVVLWSNQVPGTWANNMIPRYTIPKDELRGVLTKIYDTFDEFEPVYVVSGDTDFPTEETVAYYQDAFDLLAERKFPGLKTMHIKGRFTDIPDVFAEQMDFYLYQSGHNSGAQAMAYTSAEVLTAREPKRPVINSEPCYDQMGYSHKLYGRFGRFEIRRAAWQSLLSGACAGITYGAHGVWNWVSTGFRTTLSLGEGFDAPQPHQIALEFSGAWDYGFMHELFDVYGISTLVPCRELVKHDSPEIRMAKTPDESLYLVYLPVNTKLALDGDFTSYSIRAYDLSSRRTACLNTEQKDSQTLISMHPFEQDVVLVMKKA